MREDAKAQVKVKGLKMLVLKVTEEISFAFSLLSCQSLFPAPCNLMCVSLFLHNALQSKLSPKPMTSVNSLKLSRVFGQAKIMN